MHDMSKTREEVYEHCAQLAEAVANASAQTICQAYGEMSMLEIQGVRYVMTQFATVLRNHKDAGE